MPLRVEREHGARSEWQSIRLSFEISKKNFWTAPIWAAVFPVAGGRDPSTGGLLHSARPALGPRSGARPLRLVASGDGRGAMPAPERCSPIWRTKCRRAPWLSREHSRRLQFGATIERPNAVSLG